MVIYKKASKIWKFLEVLLVEVVFAAAVFAPLSVNWSHDITESLIKLATFLQVHVAGFQT